MDFDEVVLGALDTLPRELGEFMSNIDVVVEEEPPAGMPLLGLYQGVPLTRRSSYYAGALPDKITIFRGPLERATDTPSELYAEVQATVIHEVAHHFGMDEAQIADLGFE